MSDPREQVIEIVQEMSRKSFTAGTSGNVSARVGTGMCITPSGVDYNQLTPSDLVTMQADASWSTDHPDRRPSSEWRFHLAIYAARPDVQAVVHAHPRHATALAVHGKDIGPFHYMVGVAGGRDIRCAPYATFGTEELSAHAVAALSDRRACLLAHHGLIAVGVDLPGALQLAIEVEDLAGQYLASLAIGEPPLLSDAQMDEVLAKMASPDGYGSAPPG